MFLDEILMDVYKGLFPENLIYISSHIFLQLITQRCSFRRYWFCHYIINNISYLWNSWKCVQQYYWKHISKEIWGKFSREIPLEICNPYFNKKTKNCAQTSSKIIYYCFFLFSVVILFIEKYFWWRYCLSYHNLYSQVRKAFDKETFCRKPNVVQTTSTIKKNFQS